MSNSLGKADCYFHTSDNEVGTFWICVDPQGESFSLGGRTVKIGFDLRTNTPMKEPDELAARLRKYVSHVRIWEE